MKQYKTTAQICARLRELDERLKHRHTRKTKEPKRVQEWESTMTVSPERRLKGSYRTATQVLNDYEQEQWEQLESRHRMFEAGKGSRYTKRVSVQKGAHFGKKSVSTTNRPTAQGEVSSCGSVITLKRFPGSRLTCVCKSRMFY